MDWPFPHLDVCHLVIAIVVTNEIALVIDFGIHLRSVIATFKGPLSATLKNDSGELSLEGLYYCLPLHSLVLSVVLNEMYLLEGVGDIGVRWHYWRC